MQKKTIIMGCTMLLLVISIVLFSYYSVNARSKITAEDAIHTVLSQYEGEVLETKLSDEMYHVKLQTEQGLYQVKVHNDGAGIYSIEALNILPSETSQPSESSPLPSAYPKPTAEPVDEQPTPSPVVTNTKQPEMPPSASPKPDSGATAKPSATTLISEAKARELALAKVNGIVEDIDLEQSGSTRYYLVEIETPEGREAELQINAASGKIMSITWSEDDDDDIDD